MPSRKVRRQSLFDASIYAAWPSLSALTQRADDPDHDLFAAGFEDEAAFDSNACNASVAGPLKAKVFGDIVDLSRLGTASLQIPQWVESDALKFIKCTASGILVVEKGIVAHRLMQYKPMKELNLVIVNSSGFPFVRTRRFIHRLSKEMRLPVYLLTDSDTWGYFIFSVLKRGMFSPNDRCDFLSVDVRFMGLRAGECQLFDPAGKWLMKWEEAWSDRLRHMRRYQCFQSAAWKREFASFRRQKGKFELEAVAFGRDPETLKQYLQNKLKKRDWLT